MKISLSAEHSSELIGHSSEDLLDGGAVAEEGGGDGAVSGRDVVDRGGDVVGDPLDEEVVVLLVNALHAVIDIAGGDLASEDAGGSEVETTTRIAGAHHVLVVELLGGELADGVLAVSTSVRSVERSIAGDEEVETREGNKVDGELSEVAVELTGVTEGAGDAGHGLGDEAVHVGVAGGLDAEGAVADVVEGLVIEDDDLIAVLEELVDGEGGVVGLNDGVGDLGGGEDGEGEDHAIGVLLLDLAEEKGTHTGTGTTTEGMGELEALELVAGLGLLSERVNDGLDELATLGVVASGPVVAGAGGGVNEVVGLEHLADGLVSDGVDGAGLATAVRGGEKANTDRQGGHEGRICR